MKRKIKYNRYLKNITRSKTSKNNKQKPHILQEGWFNSPSITTNYMGQPTDTPITIGWGAKSNSRGIITRREFTSP